MTRATSRQRLGNLWSARADDRGATLMETVVAMMLMTIFLGIFTTAVVQITRSTLKVEGMADSVQQANTAFLGLERSIRYASAMTVPTRTAGGTWFVSFLDRDANDVERCTQLRVASNQLQRRTWTPQGDSYASGTLTPWRPLASNVGNGTVVSGLDAPFQTVGTESSTPFKRLKVVLLLNGSSGNTASTHRSETTYTALNSADSSTDICNQSTVGTP